ncbi:hypothetical protein [Nocardioides sp. NPDC004968]|uniref:hypothetical protein n=1 Tax=Nocardioides sp. NPDC004968 TaxID=3155894 RepID=UPI0033A9A81F
MQSSIPSAVLCTLALLGWDLAEPLAHLRESMQRARAVAELLDHSDPASELLAVANFPTGDRDDDVDEEISRTILALAEELGLSVKDAQVDRADRPQLRCPTTNFRGFPAGGNIGGSSQRSVSNDGPRT